ncbi:alpha/beta hydrolase [Mycolicibacterium tusciae]|uniref:alpha/beta hydrolase n=1 Tax=Mycolicibacterium tusciae TaxID=75922 RepID=UPI00024A4BA4
MTRPTVSDAQAWQPDSLRDAAVSWRAAATDIHADIEFAVQGVVATRKVWIGSAAEAARAEVRNVGQASDALSRAMVLAAVAAGDAADQITIARAAVLDLVASAESEGFVVADDGTVSVHDAPTPLLIALSGGDSGVARDLLRVRAEELTRQIVEALEELGAADTDAAYDIEEAFATPVLRSAATVPAGARSGALGDLVAGWPVMSQDRIAAQIAGLSFEQRERLIADFPGQVGNTDGIPWEMRIAANRTNIAQAVLDEPDPSRRAFYRTLLGEVDDPAGGGGRVDRQIVAFDPARSSLVELNGDLATAKNVAVLVPGMNTTIEGSAANTATARRFVAAGRGDVAVLTYLGGPFPRGNLVSGVVDAASPRYALDMAPRLVAFSEDVDRTIDAQATQAAQDARAAQAPSGAPVGVTYIGHSYGGSILGTAEAMGLTADQTMYVAAAGAGVGVDDPGDWHNRNPDVLRYSMTAPGDLIQAVQGIPGGPHGADPDEMAGVIHLATGHYDDGRVMGGWGAHSDILNSPSDSWRNILAVITGDRERIREAG